MMTAKVYREIKHNHLLQYEAYQSNVNLTLARNNPAASSLSLRPVKVTSLHRLSRDVNIKMILL